MKIEKSFDAPLKRFLQLVLTERFLMGGDQFFQRFLALKPAPVSGLLSAYRSGSAAAPAASAGAAVSAPPAQQHLGNFFDQIV